MRLAVLLAVLALVGAAAAVAAGGGDHRVREATTPAPAGLRSVACPKQLPAPWECARLTVALDRTNTTPGTVDLAIALRHAPGPPRPAVLALAGGPGQAAIPQANQFASLLKPLLRGRDLLVVDPRGVGGSGHLSCPGVDAATRWSPSRVAACARRLGPAGAHYGSADTADDLEAVRTALAIPKLAVYGVSYGTKVAEDYARAHPAAVDGLVLDSPIVPDTDVFYRRSARGAARVLRNVCREDGCVHDPVRDLRAVVRRMRGGVLRGAGVTVSEAELLHAVVAGGARLHKLPPSLHQAAAGRPRQLAQLVPAVVPDLRGWADPSFSRTLYLATTCQDGEFPWGPGDSVAARLAKAEAKIDRLGDEAFAPFDRHVGDQYGSARMCASWPWSGTHGAPRPLPDVPALLLVGGDDDLAPLEGAREMARELPHARLVVVARSGHGVLPRGGPAAAALARFASLLPR